MAGPRLLIPLAQRAITNVTRISAVRVRTQLGPLIAALDARPGSDSQHLARIARQVVATQP